MSFRTLDNVDVAGKRVLLRADLNVPVRDGKISDLTRIERLTPTIRELVGKGGKVIVCSHFDRPRGKRVPEMSLAPIATALGEVLGQRVRFAEDCVGVMAEQSSERLARGDVLVLENTRFHPEEEKNEPGFSAALAKLADLYVNDAFSAAHRAHASTEGVAHLLPAYAGRLMQAELEALEAALGTPVRPVAAVVGGAKVSTKLDLLGNLVAKVNALVIGGAMANTFLSAQGHPVGRSLQEAEMHATALDILARAKAAGCEVLLPTDAVVAGELKPGVATQTVAIGAVPADGMILDVGPATVDALIRHLAELAHTGLERAAGRLRDAAVRRRHHGVRQGGGGRHREGRAAQCGGRGRHCLGAPPRRGVRPDELRLDRRGCLPGVAGGQDAARRRRARLRRCVPIWPVRTSSCRMPWHGPNARSRSARDTG